METISHPLNAGERRAEERIRVLAGAMRAFTEAIPDSQRLLEIISRRVAESLDACCAVLLLASDGKTLVPAAAFDVDPVALCQIRDRLSVTFARDAGRAARQVLESGEPLFAPVLGPEQEFLPGIGLHSLLIVPLRHQGRVIGHLAVARLRKESPAFAKQDLDFAQVLAGQAALAIVNGRLLAETGRAERRFACLSDSGIIGFVVSDLAGHMSVVNDALLKLLGYSREDILSGRVVGSSLIPPDGLEGHAQALAQLASSRFSAPREQEFLHKDGRRVSVLIGSAMIEGEEQMCIAFIVDLTARKQALVAAERLREERVTATNQQRADLAAIVESSEEAIIGKTLQGVITSWNHGAEQIFGYSAAETVGKPLSLLIPAAYEEEEAAILGFLAQGEVRRLDTVRRRKDGRTIDVSVTISPVRDAQGRVVGISNVARDITERRQNEEALARAKDAAEAANSELEAFSYSVAHDLRAPLRGMNGFAQVLLDTYGDKFDEEGKDWLREILLNAHTMGALIDSLLSLSRVTRSEVRCESVDLSAVCRAAAAQFGAAEPQRTVEWVIQDGLRATCDPVLVRALLENLLENAWKFTAKVTAPRIELGATEKDGVHVFYLRDNGAGFDMAFAKKLFAPFQRLHTVAEFPGTGIGLATVQRIVRRHGGRAWAEGAVDAGATFYFTLPATSSEART